MLLFTAVVTYSRYISRFEEASDSRVASFEVAVLPKNCKGEVNSNNVCNSGLFRPNSKIEYDFSVDTSKLDVTSDFQLVIRVQEDFQMLTLNDMKIPSGVNEYSLPEEIVFAGEGKVKDYHLVIMYQGEDTGKTYTEPVVSVSYKAEQRD